MANLKTNTTTIQSILETVNNLPEAGGQGADTSIEEAYAASANDILAPKKAYVNGEIVDGALETEELTGIEPSTEEQTFTPDSGKLYSKVVINAIDPSLLGTDTLIDAAYAASEGDILASKKAWVNGVLKTGTMVDRGTVTKTLDSTTTSYTIPAGKHSGSGKVSISTQTKSATPSTTSQTITPDSGKVLSSVSVGAIPSTYVKPTTTQTAKTWTPTTSEQSIAAGTYCSGKQTIGAIPSSYVKPSYTSAGGAYTLNPGESKTYNANTYLTSALSVTAAASSGSGYIGDYVSMNRSTSRTIEFTVSTENLIGFTVIAAGLIENISEDAEYCAAIMYNGSQTYWITVGTSTGEGYAALVERYIYCTINANSIEIELEGGILASGIAYYLFPIYSN